MRNVCTVKIKMYKSQENVKSYLKSPLWSYLIQIFINTRFIYIYTLLDITRYLEIIF